MARAPTDAPAPQPPRHRAAGRGAKASQGAREGRHRRPAQRRQDDALQRADAGRRPRPPPTRSRRSSPTSPSSTCPTSAWRRWREAAGASPQVRETIEFHDIAGLVRGASAGEGLGNRFLAEIRETDAICHVVRAHGDERVPHPDGRVDPLADAEVVEAELLLADLEQARAASGAGPQGGRLRGARRPRRSATGCERVVEALGRGEPARGVPAPALAPDAPAHLQALSSKPVLYVANVDEGDGEPPAELVEHARRHGAGCIAVSARIEAELAELPRGRGDRDARRARTRGARARAPRARRLRAARPGHVLHGASRQRGAGAGASAAGSPPGTPPARCTPTSRPASCAPR